MSEFKIASTDYIDDNFAAKADLAGKQDKLTAGENITITEDNVISAQGGGSGTWYEHDTSLSKIYIGPNYGNTPEAANIEIGRKDGDVMMEMAWSNITLQAQHGNMYLKTGSSVYIGPNDTEGIQVYGNGETHFKSSVYDKFNNEILGGGGGGGTWYEHGTDIFIGPGYGNTPSDNVDKLVLGKKDDVVKIELGSSNFAVKAGPDYNQREYINAGSGNSLYLYGGSYVYIGPNTNNQKASDVVIDVSSKITLKVDDLTLELDKTKLQKLIDKLAE